MFNRFLSKQRILKAKKLPCIGDVPEFFLYKANYFNIFLTLI